MSLFIRDNRELVEYNTLKIVAEGKNGYVCMYAGPRSSRIMDEQEVALLKEFISIKPRPRYRITQLFTDKPTNVYSSESQLTHKHVDVEEVWE